MFKFFNIIKANDEIAALTTKVDELVKHNEQLQELVDGNKQKEAAFALSAQDWATEKETLINSFEEEKKALIEGHAKAIEDLQNTVKEAQTSAGKQAADIVASLGVEPETVKLTKDDLVSKSENKSRFTITFSNQTQG